MTTMLGMMIVFVLLIWHVVATLEAQNKRLIEELQAYRPMPIDLKEEDIV